MIMTDNGRYICLEQTQTALVTVLRAAEIAPRLGGRLRVALPPRRRACTARRRRCDGGGGGGRCVGVIVDGGRWRRCVLLHLIRTVLVVHVIIIIIVVVVEIAVLVITVAHFVDIDHVHMRRFRRLCKIVVVVSGVRDACGGRRRFGVRSIATKYAHKHRPNAKCLPIEFYAPC